MRRNRRNKTHRVTFGMILSLVGIFMIFYSHYQQTEIFAETARAVENSREAKEIESTKEVETVKTKTLNKHAYVSSSTVLLEENQKDSNVLVKLNQFDEVNILEEHKDYCFVYANGRNGYIKTSMLKNGRVDYEIKSAKNDTRKSYMDYRTITLKSSQQYKLQKKFATTDKRTGVRKINNRYCIALGRYYTHEIGQYVDLILKDDTVIPCIIADAKDDKHTTDHHSIGLDGGVAEFIVDTKKLPKLAKRTGDISYASGQSWVYNVKEIKIYDKNLFSK